LSSLEKTQCKFVSKQAQDIMANSNKALLHSNFFKLVLDLFYKELALLLENKNKKISYYVNNQSNIIFKQL